MDFITTDYYFWFLPIVFLATFTIGHKKRRKQILILLVSSYVFFWLASGWHILLLLVSTITDWTASKKIHNSDDSRYRKRWLRGSLIINLGLLGLFKYLDFLIQSLNWVTFKLANSPEIDTFGLLLPVGISFYTFQTMSYTIDIYKGKNKPYEDFLSFSCYAAFFPQLVAGPIVRADHFEKEIEKVLSPSTMRIRLGLTLIVYGLAKKLIIADNMAVHVNTIFDDVEGLTNIGLVWWGALAFGIQIYCDFSAYTDIAIGSAHLLGITLPENFDSPYTATSPQDFWRKWHISLSTWLRDYLYIPLGGSRNGPRVMFFALMTTMLLGGLWHGASWNFVLWGLIHGLLLIIHRVVKQNNTVTSLYTSKPRIFTMMGWIVTQYFIFMTWLIFRLEDSSILIPALKSYIGIGSHWDTQEMLEHLPEIKFLTFGIAILFICGHLLSSKIGGFKHWISRQNPLVWGVLIGTMIGLSLTLRPAETADFIYFRF
ncbi:MAG: MBOAT family protein [archaeon]|jgi:alginate O-acetyltransferase complex protein AlgI|nr:MBOAT family protein [archaeon]